jgi:hypothetical protein
MLSVKQNYPLQLETLCDARHILVYFVVLCRLKGQFFCVIASVGLANAPQVECFYFVNLCNFVAHYAR